MPNILSGINKIAIYEPTSKVVVQLNHISPESKVSVNEPIEVPDSKGSGYYAGTKSMLEILSLDDAGYSQLKTWMEAKTPVRAVVLGVQMCVLWYESVPMTVKRRYQTAAGESNGFWVKMALGQESDSIVQAENILYAAKGWANAGVDGKVDNFVFSDLTNSTPTFVDGVQTIDCPTLATANVSIYFELVFPIEGAILNLYNNFDASNDFTDGELVLKSLDDSDALIEEESGTTSTVRTHVTPADTYKVAGYLLYDGDFNGGDTFAIKLPYLGTDARTTFGVKQQ